MDRQEIKEIIKSSIRESFNLLNEMVENKVLYPMSDKDIKSISGVYDNNGIYNAVVKIKNIGRPLRGRSEILVIKKDRIFIHKKSGDFYNYRVPGGSWEDNEDHLKAAQRECREETRMEVKKCKYFSSYAIVFNEPPAWIKNKIDKNQWWYGYYTDIYVAEYDGKYTGYIADDDKDDMIKKGDFYPISEVYESLDKHHRDAIDWYLGRREK